MAKYNLGGAVIGDRRTSSVILFGDGSKEKKRNVKSKGKQGGSVISGVMSVASSKLGSIVGSRLSSGAVIKEVKETSWELTETDEKRNKYYKCKLCKKNRVRQDNRRTHVCV